MQTIHKYPLLNQDRQEIEMPRNARILCVQIVRDAPYIFSWIRSDAPTETRTFEIFETAQAMPEIEERREYIGTFQVWVMEKHLFEVVK
jgi:hypothetical protein